MRHSSRLALAVGLLGIGLLAQGAPQQLVLTLLPKGNHPAPMLNPPAVTIREGNVDLPVSSVQAANGDAGAMELYILFDRDAGAKLQPLIGLLRQFINAQPAPVAVGFGYLQASGFQTILAPTLNHAQAAEAILAPEGGLSPSPFESMTSLVQTWPAKAGVRHEILVFSDGEVPVDQDMGDNPLVRRQLAVYQMADVVIYSIDVPGGTTATKGNGGGGIVTQDMRMLGGASASGGARGGASKGAAGGGPSDTAGVGPAALGQGYLKNVSSGTGGESYWGQGLNLPVLQGYLDDIAARMGHQYLVTFQPVAPKNPGPTGIKVSVNASNVQVSAPNAVVVQ